jgi:hypothetical protein
MKKDEKMTLYSDVINSPFGLGIQGLALDKNPPNITNSDKGQYYAGRSIRLGVCLVGAVIDLALQFFQAALFTLAIIPAVIETKYRGYECVSDAKFDNLRHFAICFEVLREKTTDTMIHSFLHECGSIVSHFTGEKYEAPFVDLANKYQEFIVNKMNFKLHH